MKTGSSRQLRIVCAEDDPADQFLLRRAAEKAELPGELKLVGNGEELLKFLGDRPEPGREDVRQDAADLVLLDLNMPLMDGREVLMLIRQDENTRHIPVVMLSTSDGENDIRECYRLGANSYIVKPRSFSHLVEAMSAIESYWGKLCKLPEPGAV